MASACSFVSPEASRSANAYNTCVKMYILRPQMAHRSTPRGSQEASKRHPGGTQEASWLHRSAKRFQQFRSFKFTHVSSSENANSQEHRCFQQTFVFPLSLISSSENDNSEGQRCKKTDRCQPRNTVKRVEYYGF